MKTISIKSLGLLLIVGIVAILITIQAKNVSGEAFTGSAAVQAIATTTVVGPQSKVTIFSNNPGGCTARAISLSDGTGMAIRFITGDPGNGDLSSTTLSNSVGLLQVGSTTETYSSGMNGCGRWVAMAVASTTVTLVEYR